MNLKKWLILDALLAFAAFSAWVVWTRGYLTIFTYTAADPASLQVLIDLVIALALVLVWMLKDARQKGIAVWPFVLVTLTLGSMGPLAYLFWREHRQDRSAQLATAG